MDRPRFDVTPERLRAYAALFEITISDAEIETLSSQLSGGLAGLADLRTLDIENVEPFVAFPIDRGQP